LEDRPLDVPFNCRRTETAIRLLYSPPHLRTDRLFLMPITFTFLVYP